MRTATRRRASRGEGSPNGLPEVRGTAERGEFWALLEGTLPLTANVSTKIIWKMSVSSADVQLVAEDSDGNRLGPIWGPEAHMGSTWTRPGMEWGAGFDFPHAGCWDVKASSAGNTAHMWFAVSEPKVTSTAANPAGTPTVGATLFPIPSTCDVTPLGPLETDRWGFSASWWNGTHLIATSLSDPLYGSLGTTIGISNDFRWELQQRAPLSISGHLVDQPDQTIQVTDLSTSLSVVYPTEISFPHGGCWQLRAEAGEQSLDFTVYVYPYGCLPADMRPTGTSDVCEP